METFYLFLVIFLFVLAIVDLSVGVSNEFLEFSYRRKSRIL